MEEYELPVSPSPLMINPGAHCLAFLPMQDSRGYLQYSAALRPHRLLRSVPLLLLSRSIYSICVSLSLSLCAYVCSVCSAIVTSVSSVHRPLFLPFTLFSSRLRVPQLTGPSLLLDTAGRKEKKEEEEEEEKAESYACVYVYVAV